ncbi:hypothetical protein D3C76_840300 [compost metagenome]
MTRINHRADDIHILGYFNEVLSYALSRSRCGISKNIYGYTNTKWSKLCFCVFYKIRNDIYARIAGFGVFKCVCTFFETFRKAHIVELNFFKAEFDSFFGNIDIVFPYIFIIRIYKTVAAFILPY